MNGRERRLLQKATTIVVAEPRDVPLFKALEKGLALLVDPAICFSSTADSSVFGSPIPRLGVAPSIDESNFLAHLCNLQAVGCTRFLVATLVSEARLLGALPASVRDRIAKLIRFTTPFTLVKSVLDAVNEDCDAGAAAHVLAGSGQILQACTIYPILKRHSHGGDADITNAFLASSRILAKDDDPASGQALAALIGEWNKSSVVSTFSETIRIITELTGLGLGAELAEAWGETRRLCERWGTEVKPEPLWKALDRLMSLLTEVRQLAEATPDSSSKAGAACDPIDKPGSPAALAEPYRILVVDDNAREWRPVFVVLASRLALQLEATITIEFCSDGAWVRQNGKEEPADLWQRLPEYDLVLLDLYLPRPVGVPPSALGRPYGLDLLKRIRRRLLRIPVVVWTSSMEPSLPANASQASGFLFKKDTTLAEMQRVLEAWLDCGKGTRGVSLLNPFFDHVIRLPEQRRIAVDFTYWALKIMDGLHGLDQCYFRFFNDHGGRHLNGVLCNLEKLIRPLLLDEGDDSTFSEDKDAFGREMLWLYVATLCHDTGMFPLPCESAEVVSHRSELLKKARKQHGMRVLALLNCPYLGSKHRELARLTVSLDPVSRLAISLIASYHSQSNKPTFDLAWLLKTGESGQAPVSKGKTPGCSCCLLEQGEASDKEATPGLGALIKCYAAQTHASTRRLERLCSLLRLADGVDIDYTRLPGSHLLDDPGRSVRDDFENFKRQVLERVDIENGTIGLAFRTPPLCAGMTQAWQTGGKTAKALGHSAEAIERAIDYLHKLAGPLLAGETFPAMVEDGFGPLAGGCDALLDAYFREPVRPSSPAEYAAISLVAALGVWCEVNERYQGIVDTKLNDEIRLGTVTFGTAPLDDLTILTLPPCYEALTGRRCPPA
jgi:CheY-like chemotaxis protein